MPNGIWMVGAPEGSSAHRLLHFDGGKWVVVQLPGIAVVALARGPDGKVRMLSHGGNYVSTGGVGFIEQSAIYVVENEGIEKELEFSPSIYINDIFASGSELFAIGESGATLRLQKVAQPVTH